MGFPEIKINPETWIDILVAEYVCPLEANSIDRGIELLT
jgi:hypothetical protein